MTAYILPSSLSLAVLFACYYFFFRKDKRFVFNRIYLLAAILFSLVAPLVVFPVPYQNSFVEHIPSMILNQGSLILQNSDALTTTGISSVESSNISIEAIFYVIYLIGVIVMAYRYVSNILLIKRLISKGEQQEYVDVKLILVNIPTSPFSFGKYIFANQEDYKNGKIDQDIIIHEKAHIEHYHTIDILFIELLLILYWFNPLLWLYSFALKANHEYYADAHVIGYKSNIDAYCHKLIDFTHNQHNSFLGSGFNYSLTKNRIIMMNRTKSSGFKFGNKLAVTAVVILLTMTAFSLKSILFQEKPQTDTESAVNEPEGWFKAGSAPSSYEIGTTKVDGNTVAYLKSLEKQTEEFRTGTIMQMASSSVYRGKRVRLTAKIKTEGLSDWCGLWFRVDGAPKEVLAFDNMLNRPIKGTTDWKQYEVVLDVSQESQRIAYGVILIDAGSVWIDAVNFEVVGTDVPTTALNNAQNAPEKPKNLDFED